MLFKFIKLSWSEKKLILLAVFYILYYWALIKLLKLSHFKKQLNAGKLITPNTQTIPETQAIKLQTLFQSVARRIKISDGCLIYAMAAKKWLKKMDISATLYLGVCKINGELKYHAWVYTNTIHFIGEDKEKKYKIIGSF